MSERTRKFDSKTFYSYAVVHESGVDEVITHLKNRHFLVRRRKDKLPGYFELFTRPRVTGQGKV